MNMSQIILSKKATLIATPLMALLITTASTQAVQTIWTGGEDELWSNSNNWNTLAVPTAADEAVINNNTLPNLPLITEDDYIDVERLTVRVTGELTMEGGSVNMHGGSGRWRVGWRNGDNASMTVTGGSITSLYTLQVCEDRGASGFLSIADTSVSIGRGITLGAVAGTGTGGEAIMIIEPGTTFECSTLGNFASQVRSNGRMTMNGGELNLNASMTVFTGGVMQVNEGIVRSTDLVILGEGENGLVDLYECVWHISSNVVATMEQYVTDEKLVGYSGEGTVIINYNEQTGSTTVTAVPEPVAAVLVFVAVCGLGARTRKK